MAHPRPPILGQFQDIGEQIVSEVKKLPTDVVGQALESVGMNTGGKKSGTNTQIPKPGMTQQEGSAYQQLDQTSDVNTKRIIARKALEELISAAPKPKEKTIWEKIMEEEAQKKETKKQQNAAASSQLPMPTGKSKKGGMYGIKAKQHGSEIGKNVKSD